MTEPPEKRLPWVRDAVNAANSRNKKWVTLRNSRQSLFLWSVEHHPHTKIRRGILEPVCYAGGGEEKVSWANHGYLVLDPVMRRPSGDDIEFVTLMGHLRSICGLGSEPDFKIAVTKDFG
jgi:hypothetical protein